MTEEPETTPTPMQRLWDAAVTHCMVHYGEHMEGDPEFEMPDDPNEVMRIVAEYLEGST